MNDEIRSMLKDAGIIVAITLIAGLVLGGVYQLTKEPIAEQKRLKNRKPVRRSTRRRRLLRRRKALIRRPPLRCWLRSILLRISMK